MHLTAREEEAGSGTYDRVQAFITQQYSDIMACKDLQFGEDENSATLVQPRRRRVIVALAGDSAGGNLCVSLALALQQMGKRVPPMVLLSPWLHPQENFTESPQYLSPMFVDYINPNWGILSRQRYYGPDSSSSDGGGDSAKSAQSSNSSRSGSVSSTPMYAPLMYYGREVHMESAADTASPRTPPSSHSGGSSHKHTTAAATGTCASESDTTPFNAGASPMTDMFSYDQSDRRLLVNHIPELAPLASHTLVLVGQRELLHDQIYSFCAKWDTFASAHAAKTTPIPAPDVMIRSSRCDTSFQHLQVVVGEGEVHVYPLAWRPLLDLLLVPLRALLGHSRFPAWLHTFTYDTMFSEMNLFLDKYTPAQHAVIDMAQFIARNLQSI